MNPNRLIEVTFYVKKPCHSEDCMQIGAVVSDILCYIQIFKFRV